MVDKPLAIFFCPELNEQCLSIARPIAEQWLTTNQRLSMVALITPSGWNETRSFATKHHLPQLLLSDADGSIVKSFGLTHKTAASHAFLLDSNLKVLVALETLDSSDPMRPLLAALPKEAM